MCYNDCVGVTTHGLSKQTLWMCHRWALRFIEQFQINLLLSIGSVFCWLMLCFSYPLAKHLN